MCAVSMVTDYYREKWPMPMYPIPQGMPEQKMTITLKEWQEYQELKKRMAGYDKKTGQPDCVKPEVDEWEKRVMDILVKAGVIKRVQRD